MTIVYSIIARSSVILCSHQIGAGSFQDIAKSMLPNIATNRDGKTTYTSDSYKFHTVIENGLIFMCVADASFGSNQPYAYLQEIKGLFLSGSLASRAHFAVDGELDRDFSQIMATQMERFSQPQRGGQGNDNISTLQAQVNEVKGVMTQNIEKVLQRGERLEDLMEKTTDLEAHSNTFRKTSRRVHTKMYWKNMKMKIIIGAIVLVVILVIILIILFSTGVLPPKGKPTPTPTPKTP